MAWNPVSWWEVLHSPMFLLLVFRPVLSVIARGVLMSPTTTVYLCISPFRSLCADVTFCTLVWRIRIIIM